MQIKASKADKIQSTEHAVKSLLTFINISLLVLAGVIAYYSFKLPDRVFVTGYAGYESANPYGDLPRFVTVESDDRSFPVSLMANNADALESESTITYNLFDIIPIKRVTVTDIGTPMLVPSGEPFGIKMLTDGVMVADVNGFETAKGFVSPAKTAGIKPGDVIKTVSGVSVTSNKEIADVIKSGGGAAAEVVYVRDGHLCEAVIAPEQSSTGVYKAGMWVRDSSAGIGTLTFFDTVTGRFAGLGHPVCDALSGELMPLASGEAVEVSVGGVVKGRSGYPGELTGSFLADGFIGELLVNSHTGVYGTVSGRIINEDTGLILPLATNRQIKKGQAYILSTVEGESPRLYEIVIEDIENSPSSDSKDMVIRVTDEALIEKTGGIVQGMSGSPIIQNGMLVGAVTHVFVNNPQKGYGIFADVMYSEMQGQQKETLNSAA